MQTENPIENGAAVENAPDSPTATARAKRRTAPPSMPPKAGAPDTPPETAADGASAEPAEKPARRAKAKKRGAPASQGAQTPADTATEAAPQKPAKKAPAKKTGGRAKAPAKGGLTLADVATRFLAHLEEEGCAAGTVGGYAGELTTAAKFLGADTLVGDLTPERVAAYFACDRVTRTRAGEPKSQRTIDKSRRVLRLALCWAAETGLVEKAPIPEPAQ